MDGRVALPADTIVDGSYRIARVVGAGGFGITYAAEDVNLATTVALKEYYPAAFGDRDRSMRVQPRLEAHARIFEWGRASFLEEARTLARFEHPSIVGVSRAFEANATAYMVMRFESGRSFEAWLADLGRCPTQEELDAIIAPVLDALEMMHAQNFLHRDVAPDNLIVRADGPPVLLDFGSARRAVAEASRALTGVTKAGYSPHEQYSSNSRLQGPWSDLYALGGTLYRAVTGVAPEEATLRVHDDAMPAASKAAKGSYRPRFLAAIDACLEVRHSERPQSVPELRAMLLDPSSLTEPDMRPTTATAKARPARWHRAGNTAAALLLGGVLAVAAYVRTPSPVIDAREHAYPVFSGLQEQPATETGRPQGELPPAATKPPQESGGGQEGTKAPSSATTAKKTSDENGKAAFDGDWQVVGVGGDWCRNKSWEYRISIKNNQIIVPGLPPGRVHPDGRFSYKYVAVGWKNIPPGNFSGKLTGDAGSGRYDYSDLCLGSMKLRRL